MNRSRFAVPSDPAAAAMMNDLGVQRRDEITSADGPNYSGLTSREERAQRLQARQEADDRRTTREQGEARGDSIAIALNRWHDPAYFDPDPAAANSVDIAGGQAHRARLSRMRATGQLRDEDDRHCPSRRLPPPSSSNRDTGGANYVATAGPSTQRTTSSSTPRRLAGLQSTRIPTNSAPPSTRPSGQTRATSPRSYGTVRFGAPGRSTARPASVSANEQLQPGPSRPVLQGPTPALRATASTASAPRTIAGASVPARPSANSSTASAASRPTVTGSIPPHMRAAAATTTTTTAPAPPVVTSAATTQVQRTATTSTATASTPRRTPGPGEPSLNTLHHPEDGLQRQMLQQSALWYAAAPDSAAAARWIASHPIAPAYLREARRRLVNEVTQLALDVDPKEIDRYTHAHKERKWMLAAALKAAELLQYGTSEETRAHYAQNEEYRDFYEIAVVLRRTQRSTTTGAPASASFSTATSAPTTSSPTSSAASTVVPASSLQAPARVTATRSPHAAVTDALPRTSAPTPQTATNTPEVSRASAATIATAATMSTPAGLQAPGTNATIQPAGSVSTSSSRSSLHSATTDVTVPPARQGSLNITFMGVNGNFLGHESVTVNAPVNANLNVTSTAADFDPRTFVNGLRAALESDAFACAPRTDAALATATADEGIYASDDEL